MPIAVAQFANGQDFDNTTGDPFMMLLPPVEQFGGNYLIEALSLAGSRHYWEEPGWSDWGGYDPENPGVEYSSYMSLIRFGAAGDILFDGQILPGTQFQPIGNSGYFGASLAVSNGSHRVSGTVPFGVSVYGWAPYESYAFLGGIYTDSVEAGTQLQLTQATPYAAVGSQKVVTAHVSKYGAPLRDVEVAFSTTGTHIINDRVRTSRFGDAIFTYTGNSAGIDIITATLVDQPASVTNIWVVPTDNTPPLVYATNTATIQHSLTIHLSGTVYDLEQSVGNGLSTRWRLLDGPGAVILADAGQPETFAECGMSGVYLFEFSASDAQFSSRTLVTVRVDLPPNILLPKPYTEIPSLVVVGTEVQLTSEAWDGDDSIDRVEFYANGSLIGRSTNSDSWTGYGLLWPPTTNGWFGIQAVAYDSWGGAATSSVVNVQATYAPQVLIDNLANGAVVTVPTNVPIHAHAFDPDGNISSLSIFVNGELHGTTSNTDLTVTWVPRRQGDYTLSAVATDDLGIVTTSENVTVTVTGVFPQVAITNPVPVGFAFETPTGKPIQLAASASIAAPYTITNVVFTAWEVELNDSEAPYQIEWAPQRGNSYYQFVAEAYADSGAIGTSAGVYVHTFVDASASFAKPVSGQTVYVGRPQQVQMELRDPWNILEQNTFDFYLPTGWLTSDYLGRTTNNNVLYWTPPAPGDYTLIAVGSPFYFWTSVIVTAVEPPVFENVRILLPTDGSTNYPNVTVPIVVGFDSSTGIFDHVEFFVEGQSLGTSTTNDFILWTPSVTSDYVLSAKVFDSSGNGVDATNTVTVHVVTPPRPTISITRPSESGRLKKDAQAFVLADVKDPGLLLTNLSLYVDGTNAVPGLTYFIWTPTENGSHVLQIIGSTYDGETIQSDPVNVVVANLASPIITFLSPTNEERMGASTTTLVSANATDIDGSVTNLSLTLDFSPIGETNGAALEVLVTNIAPGWHEVAAQAIDDDELIESTVTPVRFFIGRPEIPALQVPAAIAAQAISSTEIQLSWEAITTNAITRGVIVERWDPVRLLWTELGETDVAATSYDDANLNPETNYRYRIASLDLDGGRSAYSAEVDATTRTRVPVYAVIDLSAQVAAVLTNSTSSANILTNTDLRHFDVRRTDLTGPAYAAAVLGSNAASVTSAVARFNERWPQIQLDYDPVLLSPKSILPRSGFLTGPGGYGVTVSQSTLQMFDANDPHRVAKAFLQDNRELFGFGADAITNSSVRRDYVDSGSGMRTVVWQQNVANVPVFNALFVAHITTNEELASVSSQFTPGPAQAADPAVVTALLAGDAFPVSTAQALMTAVTNVGDVFDIIDITSQTTPHGVTRTQDLAADKGIKAGAHAELTWFPASRNELKLAWQVIFSSKWRNEMYLTVVSALDNEILYRRNLTADSSPATYRVFTGASPAPMSPGLSTPGTTQASLASRSLQTFTALDAIASPDGWIPDGINETHGNNVDAHLDRDDDDFADLPRTTGTPGRVFDFPLNLNDAPGSYGDAAAVQLFYWNNWMHDALYGFGFTEGAGNFQNNNFGRGGLGDDAVQADAQDGLNLNDGQHRNNANMSTPPDGFAPRMQMYDFDGSNPDRDGSLDAEVILHEYAHGLSTRLIGGGAGIDALQTAGMGEGWSDFYALAMLTDPNADVDGAYTMGAYSTHHGFGSQFEENYYYGIRRYPYCTDTNKNPLVFSDIDPTQATPHAGVPRSPLSGPFNLSMASEVHYQGEVWCSMLWEIRANLIRKHGGEQGNSLALELVTQGLKLSPPNPSFVQARDAILLADRIVSQGANASEIWAAFSKRGLGYEAKAPYAYTTIGAQASSTLAPALVVQEVQIQGGNDNGIIEANEDNSLLIVIRNQGSTGATQVSAQITTTTPGVQILQGNSSYRALRTFSWVKGVEMEGGFCFEGEVGVSV